MSKQLIYQNKIMQLFLYQEEGVIYMDWTNFFSTEGLLRKAIEEQNKLVEKLKIRKVIVDSSKVVGETIAEEEMQWIAEVNFPLLEQLGLTHMVTIVSPDMIVNLTNEFWQETVFQGLTLKNVNSKEEAFAYLADK